MADASSRLAIDRRTVLAGSVAVAAGLAGCGDGDGEQRGDPGDPLEYVPASASVVVGADMALTDSEETVELLETYAEEEDLLERFESRTGIDPERLENVLSFGEEPRSEDRTFVVDADVDESEARSAAEEETGADYEEVEHDNGVVYSPTEGEGPSVGTAAEGQYVVGAEASVKTALDVFQGDADGLGDPLGSAFEDAREGQGESGGDDGAGDDGVGDDGGTGNETGNETQNDTDDGGATGNETDDGGDPVEGLTQYVTSATDRPREYLPSDDSEQVPGGVSLDLYEELEVATAEYAAGGGEVALEVDLRAPDADVAQQIAEFTGTLLMFLRSQAPPDVGAQVARVELERSESVVTVAYRSPLEDAVTLVEWLSQMTAQ